MSMVDSAALPPEPPPMADPGGVPMPSQPPPSVPGVASGVNLDQLARDAAGIQREKMAATSRVDAANVAALERDRARMEQQYAATGIGPDELKPWDADAAREQFRHDPIEEFGSIGSIFAIVASAFTNQPMNNAFIGAAAAINAAKEGKATEFDRAYKAWQDNTKLAIERSKIQNQQFDNAFQLFNTDMKLGAEKAQLLATQYGDKQMLLLLEHSLYDKAIDLKQKRVDIETKQEQNFLRLTLENYKMNDLLGRGYNPQQPATPESQRAIQQWRQDWSNQKYDEDSEFARKWWSENPKGTSEQFAAAFGKFKQLSGKTSEINLLAGDRLKKQAIVRETEKILAANPEKDVNTAFFEATQKVEENLPGKVQERKVARDSVTNQIDAALTILQKYKDQGVYELSPAGAGGFLQRGKEFLAGPSAESQDATQFHQYQKLIQAQLQAALPASVRGKMNMRDRADYEAIIGATPMTNVQQAIEKLETLKRIINKQNLLETENAAKAGAIPLPPQYKDRPDGTRFPVTKGDKKSIYIKRGNQLVPE